MADFRHANFGITHRRRRVTIDRAEVALTIDQWIAQGEVLRHTYYSVINGDVAVRVVFTDYVTDDTGGFFVRAVPVVV